VYHVQQWRDGLRTVSDIDEYATVVNKTWTYGFKLGLKLGWLKFRAGK
jgi:hypothetical protein